MSALGYAKGAGLISDYIEAPYEVYKTYKDFKSFNRRYGGRKFWNYKPPGYKPPLINWALRKERARYRRQRAAWRYTRRKFY